MSQTSKGLTLCVLFLCFDIIDNGNARGQLGLCYFCSNNIWSSSGQCGTPNAPSYGCPVPWYRPTQSYYWDSNVGNCLPYFGGESSCSSGSSPSGGNNYDDNVYSSYEDCMSVCSFRQRQEQGMLLWGWRTFTRGIFTRGNFALRLFTHWILNPR